MAGNKFKRLSLSTKQEILKFLDSGNSQNKTAKKFSIAKTTVNKINQDRHYIIQQIENGEQNNSCRKIRKIDYDDVNILVWNWLKRMKQSNIPVLGSNLKEVAKLFAKKIGIYRFRASNGWFKCFSKRYSISFKMFDRKSLASNMIDDVFGKYKVKNFGNGGWETSDEDEDSSETASDYEDDCISSYFAALKSIQGLERFFVKDDPELCRITDRLTEEILNKAKNESKVVKQSAIDFFIN